MTITMSGKEYNDLLKYLKGGLSKDNAKPQLQQIHVFNDGHQVIFETCNGFMIKRQTFTADGEVYEFDITIEIPPIKVAVKDVIGIEFLTAGINLFVNGTMYLIQSTEMEYVNTVKIFNKPDREVIEYGFTVEFLKNVLNGYTGRIKMTFNKDNNHLPVYIEPLEVSGKKSMIMPVNLRK